MTATFDDSGTYTRTYDCFNGPKGKKEPLALTDLYFVDTNKIAFVPDFNGKLWGTCLEDDETVSSSVGELERWFNGFGSSRPATWTVEGDTLTLADDSGYTRMTFERTPS